jgi:uncharacterized membrane protein
MSNMITAIAIFCILALSESVFLSEVTSVVLWLCQNLFFYQKWYHLYSGSVRICFFYQKWYQLYFDSVRICFSIISDINCTLALSESVFLLEVISAVLWLCQNLFFYQKWYQLYSGSVRICFSIRSDISCTLALSESVFLS